MTTPSPQDQVARSLNRLTVAVWVLSALLLVSIALSMVAFVFRIVHANEVPSRAPGSFLVHVPGGAQADTYNGFQDWPLDRQIKASTVIVLTKWRKAGDRDLAVVDEILKQAPGVAFACRAGDEIPSESHVAEANADYGDGEVLFYTGSPARFRYGITYSGNRITGLGDMPMDDLRAAIQKDD